LWLACLLNKLLRRTFLVILNLGFPSQVKDDEGLDTGEYMIAVRLFSENHSISVVQQQSARTCAATGEHSSQNTRKVNWNEMFFFKVERVVCKHNTFWNTFTPLGLDIPWQLFSTVISGDFSESHVFI
jgi:hypothetical protein